MERGICEEGRMERESGMKFQTTSQQRKHKIRHPFDTFHKSLILRKNIDEATKGERKK